jgi:3-oxoacyl-[acyl-carrier protein] reductase
LDSQNVIITGGQGDLAVAMADALRQAGYQVMAPGRKELEVTSASSVKAFFAPITSLDLLINNAGLTRDIAHTNLTEADWDLVVDTNLKGSFLCSQAALKIFCRQNAGHILNIGSFSGKCPPIGQANYAAAKAGLIGLTQSLAKEYGKRNIRVNAILPGFLETKMTADLSEQARQRVLDRHVLGRLNTVSDAARFVACLHQMSAVSGQIFQLDSRI